MAISLQRLFFGFKHMLAVIVGSGMFAKQSSRLPALLCLALGRSLLLRLWPHTSTKPGMVRCRTQDYLITSHIGNTLSFWELTPEAELPCVPLATYTPTV